MFDEFKEMDSVDELNQAAAALKQQGDEEKLIRLAEENGIDREDAEDYYDGTIDVLATPAMAAIGKLAVESKDLKLGGVLLDWMDELRNMCIEDEAFARAVRRKGKDLGGYIALTVEEGYKNRAVVDWRIVNKTERVRKILRNHELAIGIPNKKSRRCLARIYYLE